jgi:hypothetical protein
MHVSEKAEIFRSLVTVLYPIPSEIPSRYSGVLALLAATQKYDMFAAQSSIRALTSQKLPPIGAEASAYAFASKNNLLLEAKTAARLTLNYPLTFEFLGPALKRFEGCALRDLARFRKSCRDRLVSCFQSFLDTRNGPSKVWRSCSNLEASSLPHFFGFGRPTTGPTLPLWLRDLFMQQIRLLKENFTNPLPNPSSIRGSYLEALRVHIQASGGCSCSTIHALEGEKYCAELEQKVAGAVDEASHAFTSQGIPWQPISAGTTYVV